MVQVSGDVIQKALAFIDNLKDERGASYCEIAEDDPNERKVFPQSQHLPYVTFKGIGREDLAEKIAQEHDFGKEEGENEILASVRRKLNEWQDQNGGWRTDRTNDLKPHG